MVKNDLPLNAQLSRVQSLLQSGQTLPALERLTQLSRQFPRNDQVWFMQAIAYVNSAAFNQAISCFKKVVRLNPRHTLALFNLGNVLQQTGRTNEAIAAYSKALKLEPHKVEIMNVLAGIQLNTGGFKQAIQLYKRFLKLQPDNSSIVGKLAACYFLSGQLEKAVNQYQSALTRQKNPSYYDGLGATLCQQGKYIEAVEAHRSAVQFKPDNPVFHSNLLLTLNYLPDIDQAARLDEHKKWEACHQQQRCQYKAADTHHAINNNQADRKRRVGYVSPDFRTHSVGYFFEPLLENHNHQTIETYCYACTPHHDETTERLKRFATHWRDISALDDKQAADQIQNDSIDILVDLAGHTARNRLTIFTAKPAPIQVTWLGYPATTGLSTIDYRLTDKVADLKAYQSFYTEQLVHLDGCFLCYRPPCKTPVIQAAPVEKNKFITFGSFNNLAKINQTVVKLWSDLLLAIPDSHLVLKNPSLTDPVTAKRYLDQFVQYGISEKRIRLLGLAPTISEHLNTYNLVDIALDPFPYNGTTTTCEALQMGTPVITLSGTAHAGRVGKTILTAVGLNELVAETEQEYIAIASRLVADVERVKNYNSHVQSLMHNSILCDGRAFAEKIEKAYQQMWYTLKETGES